MHGTRRTGPVYTSVRLHPVKLMMLGIALCMIGGGMLNGFNILTIIGGAAVILLGCWLIYVAIRQIIRGARTFLS